MYNFNVPKRGKNQYKHNNKNRTSYKFNEHKDTKLTNYHNKPNNLTLKNNKPNPNESKILMYTINKYNNFNKYKIHWNNLESEDAKTKNNL